ncbi:hypothetical protein MACK_003768 [Theileria orientalis]|uniref:Uncharacterized protein n=1 Tax=Theileria orientalis TaxID=68886 RepID=A0A976SIU0_THEOR|nr:hypothetical protein MACK_003768 [Theileria orientalis]
MRVCVWRRIE